MEALELHACTHDRHPLLIHISTDQVYDGSKANWREDDVCGPVNTYGRTKLQAEQFLQVLHGQGHDTHQKSICTLLECWAIRPTSYMPII